MDIVTWWEIGVEVVGGQRLGLHQGEGGRVKRMKGR